ncbi:MAG TPA: DUF2231 domain-containing protein [Actinomycetota bacterium]|nr:DUF2231 domain-containing protein [Actinomycetota bacterium]
MESRAKLAGHAIHPMLITLPLGLLGTAVVFDVLYLITNTGGFATASFYMLAAGIIGGLLTAVFGLWDWLAIPAGTRAKRVGLWHGAGNVVVVVLFALACWSGAARAAMTRPGSPSGWRLSRCCWPW